MRHLVAFSFLIIIFIICSSQSASQHFDVISSLDDSITDIIGEKEFLYYTKGHNGHIWSLAVPGKDYYIIVSGNTRNKDCRIDSISINEPLLKWGLDTMALYCHKMKPVERSFYWPFYERLVLFSSQKEIIIDCADTDTYSGTDSVAFNTKLNELKYLMYWLATSAEIQKRLPSPL